MLPATEEEIEAIREYMQRKRLITTVEFLQKIYLENVGSVAHAIWDIHTDKGVGGS